MAALKRSTEAISLVGVAAAVVVAVLFNVLAARHYTRADWTAGKLYTLTKPTTETLHALDDQVQIWVLLGGGDPMEQSIRHLMASYEAETSKLDVHYIDPDKDALALQDVRKRFKVEATPAPDGRMVADAIVIVARGDRHWFLTPRDMVEVAPGDDIKAKPREEQAITAAIRRVVAGDKTKLCFLGRSRRAIDRRRERGGARPAPRRARQGQLRVHDDRHDPSERVRAVQGVRRGARRGAAPAGRARARRADRTRGDAPPRVPALWRKPSPRDRRRGARGRARLLEGRSSRSGSRSMICS